MGLLELGIAALTVAAAGTGYSIYSGERAASAQRDAQQQAKDAAVKQENAANEANNRANQKKPDITSILSAAQNAAKGGVGSTMLTGPTGVDTGSALGKSSLLGS